MNYFHNQSSQSESMLYNNHSLKVGENPRAADAVINKA